MYFPLLRGKQFELVALKEFAEAYPGNQWICPIIEPVRVLPDALVRAAGFLSGHSINYAVILNPENGDYAVDTNRFDIPAFLQKAKLENAGWKTLLDNRFQLNPGDSFYRARIHYKKSDVFGVGDMGAPKREDSKSGRANPEGIPFLYLSEEAKTTLYETRVIKHDVVTVGEFRIVGKDPLFVEDLTEVDLDDIELLDEDVVTLAKRKLLIRALSQDMSHPMRRFDSAVEYVPTQFICEYVQLTQSVTGIRFSSSVYPGGTNIVIFDPALMSCVAVKDYNIGELEINETTI